MADYKQGDIVLAWVPDPDGRSIQWPHPAIILNKTADIAPDKPIVVIDITKNIDRPLKTGHFLMPWKPEGDERTGLTYECVAKCDWRVRIAISDIVKLLGYTPAKIWEQIVVEVLHQIQEKKKH